MNALHLLEQAYEASERELGHIMSGDVEKAEQTMFERKKLLDQALSKDVETVDGMLEKLHKLKKIHGRITVEARKLHQTLHDDLLKARKKGRGISGYHKAARRFPREQSVYISKRG